MGIEKVLDTACINLAISGHSKDEVIREMVAMLYEAGRLSDEETFIEDVYKREAEGETGIGEGVAIPHGRSSSVLRTSIAIGRADHEIEWESVDEKPVRFVIMFAVKEQEFSEHIKYLSHVAQLLCEEEVLKVIFETDDKDEIVSVFRKGGE